MHASGSSNQTRLDNPLAPDARLHVAVIDVADGAPDPVVALDFVADDAFGGIDLFVGRVRAANQGREVVGIHYDMFDPLALATFRHSADAALAEFGPAAKAYVAHAKGRLRVGDVAVVVAFATPHRDAAFRGCRAVIEAVKHEAPIWKQEHYIDGSSEWSEGCALCVEPATTASAPMHMHMQAPAHAPLVAPSPAAFGGCGCDCASAHAGASA